MYVYLVQPVALVGTDRYKIGMSSLDNFSRIQSYSKGTRVLMTIDCDDAKDVEKKLIKAFNFAYKCIAGNEYFEINTTELKMINLFVSTVMDHKNNLEEVQIAKKKINWMDNFAFKLK